MAESAPLRRAVGRRRVPPQAGFDGRRELESVVATIGAPLTAELLGVSRQQPSAWSSRRERIGAENRRKLSDLYYLVGRLSQVVHPARIAEWLTTPSVALNGGRPQDVLRIRGPVPLIEIVDRLEQGAYA